MPEIIARHYAHSLKDRPLKQWQTLEDHLSQTAGLAERFGASFAPGWGRLAGLWHDAGKYRRAFQQRIGAIEGGPHGAPVDHKSVGALIARECGAAPLAFAIAGHHGGMADGDDLGAKLAVALPLLAEARRDGLPVHNEQQPLPAWPHWILSAERVSLSLWIRFLFSALVDADFLDTERFYAAGAERSLGIQPSLVELKARLDEYMGKKARSASRSLVNEMRERVLSACRQSAS